MRRPTDGAVRKVAAAEWAAWADADYALYVVAMTEQGAGSGRWLGNLPAGVTAPYSYEVMLEAIEDTPAKTDLIVGVGSSLAATQASVDALPSAADIDTQLSGTHGAGSWQSSTGDGAIEFTYTVTRSDTGAPLQGVLVQVATDEGGDNVIAEATTNALGQVVFNLDAGTYYLFRRKAGFVFTDPDTEVVA